MLIFISCFYFGCLLENLYFLINTFFSYPPWFYNSPLFPLLFDISSQFFPFLTIITSSCHFTACTLLYCYASSSRERDRQTEKWTGEEILEHISDALEIRILDSCVQFKRKVCQVSFSVDHTGRTASFPIRSLTNRAVDFVRAEAKKLKNEWKVIYILLYATDVCKFTLESELS